MKKFSLLIAFFLVLLTKACNPPESQSTPESQGISSRAILEFLEALDREQPGALHGFVLKRYGKTLAEGWWEPYDPSYRHMLYSLSKSFTSVAVGMAQAEGLLSIDSTVISFFPDSTPQNVSDNLGAMRVRDLLKMNSGHQDGTMWRITGGEDWVKNFLALEVDHKPGTHFLYNTGASFMLSAIVQEVCGQTLMEFLTPRLFEPLAIQAPTWETNPAGINMGGFGLSITTRDIANFGQLLLQEGQWEGDQLLPAEWIREATSFQTSNGSNPESDWEQGYGYQFWMCRHGLYRGDGAFGQFCIVFEDQDAVLAINSGTGDMQGIMNLVWEHLLPALKPGPLSPDPEGQNLLERKLASLSIGLPDGGTTNPEASGAWGKPYRIQPNSLSIESVAFDFGEEKVHIHIQTPEGARILKAGLGSWMEGNFEVPLFESPLVHASGAWRNEDTFEVRLCYPETPYLITFVFRFKGEEITWNTSLNVGFGNTEFEELQGKQLTGS
jgi:CubicO group peptidase (beta-lactamase class C family)